MHAQLQAEESITAANRIAVGTGRLRREDHRRLTGQWQRCAAGTPSKAVKATPDTLRAMGIRFVDESQHTHD